MSFLTGFYYIFAHLNISYKLYRTNIKFADNSYHIGPFLSTLYFYLIFTNVIDFEIITYIYYISLPLSLLYFLDSNNKKNEEKLE
jgi:hypothetical protein